MNLGCLAGDTDRQLQFFEPAHQQARQPTPYVSDVDRSSAVKQSAQHDRRFQAGERGAHAKVRSFTEGDVSFAAGAVESELVGCVEVSGIPVGRTPQQQQTRSCPQLRAAEGGIDSDVPVMATKRRLISQRLVDESSKQFRVFADLLLNIGPCGQYPRGAAKQ